MPKHKLCYGLLPLQAATFEKWNPATVLWLQSDDGQEGMFSAMAARRELVDGNSRFAL